MVNIARGAGRQETRIAQFDSRSIGDRAQRDELGQSAFVLNLHLAETQPKPESTLDGFGIHGAASWKRQGYFSAFPVFELLEPNFGWSTGPDSEATLWTIFGQEVQK
jgi:hypothetical protein